jgi:hypothetical protein
MTSKAKSDFPKICYVACIPAGISDWKELVCTGKEGRNAYKPVKYIRAADYTQLVTVLKKVQKRIEGNRFGQHDDGIYCKNLIASAVANATKEPA